MFSLKKSWKVLYFDQAAWKVGEVESDRDTRLRARAAVAPTDRYPGDYPGRVISVIPAPHEFSPGDLADPNRRVVTLSLTDSERASLASRLSKVALGALGDLAVDAVSFDHRWGRLAPVLRRNFDDAEKAERESDDADLAHLEGSDAWRFAELAALNRRMLPPTETHSGAGLYEVGPGQTYSTVQSAADQLWTDQGAAEFTAAQEIRIYDGTYTETVALNSGLRPLPKYRLIIKAADGNDSVILKNDGLSGHAFNDFGVESITLQDFEVQNNISGINYYAVFISGTSAYLSNMTIKASSTYLALYLGNLATLIEDCTFEGTAAWLVRSHGYDAVWRRCTFQGGVYDLYGCSVAFESCIFDGCGLLWHGTATIPRRIAPTVVSNCLFYNAAYAFKLASAGQGLSLNVHNCIFHTVTTCFEGTGGPIISLESNRNCFYNCGKVGSVDGTDYTSLTDWQAYSPMFGNSPDADSIESDPELVDAPNDDFSLTLPSAGDDGSPCYRAGVNAGVERDQGGNLYHERHPDIGSWSSGQEDSSAPSFSVADDETGTSFTVTVTADDLKDEIFIRYAAPGDSAWTEFGTSRRGSGTLQVTGRSQQAYSVQVVACRNGSSAAAGAALSLVKGVLVTDGSSEEKKAVAALCGLLEANLSATVVYPSQRFDPESADPGEYIDVGLPRFGPSAGRSGSERCSFTCEFTVVAKQAGDSRDLGRAWKIAGQLCALLRDKDIEIEADAWLDLRKPAREVVLEDEDLQIAQVTAEGYYCRS